MGVFLVKVDEDTHNLMNNILLMLNLDVSGAHNDQLHYDGKLGLTVR